jgi:hypothetical protein
VRWRVDLNSLSHVVGAQRSERHMEALRGLTRVRVELMSDLSERLASGIGQRLKKRVPDRNRLPWVKPEPPQTSRGSSCGR